jgi:hypothetical protein
MPTADDRVDRLADKLQAFADRSASDAGVKGKLAKPLADDAAFIRGLKPSLIKARAKGEAPTDGAPRSGTVAPSSAPPGMQAAPATKPKLKLKRPKRPKGPKGDGGGGPNPWLVVGLCLAAGIALAKWIDWRGHAHPKS